MAILFFSYSHRDEQLRDELEIHLALLKRQGVITSWHDRRISAGSDLHQTIDVELESAQIILLLVSANFLASDYCYHKEMARALAKNEEGSATVIPVILHPCDWHSAPFGSLKATPTDGRPVSMYANQQEALSIIARDVRKVAESLMPENSVTNVVDCMNANGDSTANVLRSSNLRIKRKFDDRERDEYLKDSFNYIARYFDGSLEELASRNPQIEKRFNRIADHQFSAVIYDSGKKAAQCSVWINTGHFESQSIAYSSSEGVRANCYNESLSIVDDGYTLQIKPLGMQMYLARSECTFSQQGAAEYYWSLLIGPLQD